MIEPYPEIALERFDKAGFWIRYIIVKIKKFIKNDILVFLVPSYGLEPRTY